MRQGKHKVWSSEMLRGDRRRCDDIDDGIYFIFENERSYYYSSLFYTLVVFNEQYLKSYGGLRNNDSILVCRPRVEG